MSSIDSLEHLLHFENFLDSRPAARRVLVFGASSYSAVRIRQCEDDKYERLPIIDRNCSIAASGWKCAWRCTLKVAQRRAAVALPERPSSAFAPSTGRSRASGQRDFLQSGACAVSLYYLTSMRMVTVARCRSSSHLRSVA